MTAIVLRGDGVTVATTEFDSETAAIVAVIVDVPADTPVSTPVLGSTSATAALLVDQMTGTATIAPSTSFGVAVSVTVLATATLGAAGEIRICVGNLAVFVASAPPPHDTSATPPIIPTSSAREYHPRERAPAIVFGMPIPLVERNTCAYSSSDLGETAPGSAPLTLPLTRRHASGNKSH